MAIYPQTPVPDQGYMVNDTYKTLTTPAYDSGFIGYKSLRNYGMYTATLTYGTNSSAHTLLTDLQTLYAFFRSCKGQGLPFTFVDFLGYDLTPVGITWGKLYIGVGNTVQTTFDVPMTTSSTYKLWSNGADQTTGTHTV